MYAYDSDWLHGHPVVGAPEYSSLGRHGTDRDPCLCHCQPHCGVYPGTHQGRTYRDSRNILRCGSCDCRIKPVEADEPYDPDDS